MNRGAISQIAELLRYDPQTGLLHWRVALSNRKAGDRAGGVDGSGYDNVRVLGRLYRAHVIVWALWHGQWPTCDIDHRDGDRANNRIGNLRLATRSQNNQNAKCKNKLGLKGVTWSQPGRNWKARIRLNGQQIHLGCFSTPEEAHAAYIAAAKRLFGEFARAA